MLKEEKYVRKSNVFEINMLRISLDDALEKFKELIVPEARKQQGYKGMYVMRTPEDKDLVMSLWASEETTTTSLTRGYYEEQLAKCVTIFRVPPGREHYEVVSTEPPGTPNT